MAVVAFVNQKGGVGKTTVTLGLAGAASAAGLSTLVVDVDPQANATTGLGIFDPARTVDDALGADRAGALTGCVVQAAWPSDYGPVPLVAPASAALAAREPQLANDPVGAQDRLRLALEGIEADLVLVDCPPSLGLLTINALFAADRGLVVTEPGAWATDGVGQILRTLERIRARRRDPLVFGGVVVNRLGRTRDNRYWYEQLVQAYPGQVHPPVHLRAAVAEAAAQALPLRALGARPGASDAIGEFDALLERVVGQPRPAGMGGGRRGGI